MNLDEYKAIKAKVEKHQREVDRAEGALQQILGDLKRDFGCESLKEAEALLVKLDQETEQAEQEYTEALSEFEEEWGDVIG